MVDAFEKADRHQGGDDPQELGRDLRAGQGRGGQPARRHLVGRHGRSAPAGRRGRPDRGIQVAEAGRAATTGRCASGSSPRAAPSASIRARSATATTPSSSPRRASPEPKCWADLLNPKLKDEVQVADPNSSGTAYTMLATLVQIMGEDKALRLHEGAAQEREPVHEVGRRAGQGDAASARRPSASPSCTTT